MTEKISVELGNVQKTLMLPLWGRAVESRKAHPLLFDPTALKIIESVDFDFSTMTQNISDISQATWIMRSLHVDEVIRGFLARYPDALVVNIGCGLDTTFERVDNGLLHWIDLDLPDVIELRRRFIAESARRRFVSSSFLEEGWLQELAAPSSVLFIAAGVFYYFEEDQVKNFLIRLADRFPGSEILFDASSPVGVKVANKKVIESSGLDERSYLQWGLEDPCNFSAWDKRLQVIDTHYYFRSRGKFLRLNLRLVGMLSDALKIQYMVHMKMG